MQAFLRHINFEIVKCVLIASPGFVKDQFYDYMIQQAAKMDNKALLDNKDKFLLVHASSGFKHSLKGKPTFANSSSRLLYSWESTSSITHLMREYLGGQRKGG